MKNWDRLEWAEKHYKTATIKKKDCFVYIHRDMVTDLYELVMVPFSNTEIISTRYDLTKVQVFDLLDKYTDSKHFTNEILNLYK